MSRAVLGGLGGKCSRVWWAQVEKEGFGLSVYFTCCVTSGKLPNLSVPPFLIYEIGVIVTMIVNKPGSSNHFTYDNAFIPL